MEEKVIVNKTDLSTMADAYRANTGSTETFSMTGLTSTMTNVISSEDAIYSVLYINQDLTDIQKNQVKANILAETLDSSYRVSNYPTEKEQNIMVKHSMIDVLGIPPYYNETELTSSPCSIFNLTETGWYIFLRFLPPKEVTNVTVSIEDEEAKALVPDSENYYCLPVKIYSTHRTVKIVFSWDGIEETWFVRAQDLANYTLDYRASAYIFDLSPYVSYTYKASTTGTLFTNDRHYYLQDGEEYIEQTVTSGEKIPSGTTYYEHSKTRIEGFPLNTIFQLTDIDSQSVLVLPDPPEDGYCGWFKIYTNFLGNYSITIENAESFIWANKNFAPTGGTQILYGEWHGISKKWRLNFTSFEPAEE